MQALIRSYNDAFDAYMAPLAVLGRWAEILGVAAVLGIVVSLIFAALVRGERLRQARDELWAALFEIWLYRREPLLVWQAQLALLKANLRYSSILLVPLGFSLLASAPLLIQAHYRFALAPIPSGAETLLTAVLARPAADVAQMDCKIEWVQGVGVLSPSVREPALHRLVWRLQPEGSGEHVLRVTGLWADRGISSVRRWLCGEYSSGASGWRLGPSLCPAHAASKRRFWLGPHVRRVSPCRNRMAGLADGSFPALRLCRQSVSEQVSGRSQPICRWSWEFNQLG